MKVTVLQNIMNANDQIAARNQALLEKNKVLAINVMSSPGAGKTTLLLETIRRLKKKVRIAVIEAISPRPSMPIKSAGKVSRPSR